MHVSFRSQLLGMVLLSTVTAVEITQSASSKSIAEKTKALEPVEPVITSPPQLLNIELKGRADNSDFIGWYSAGGYWYSMTCGSGLMFYGVGTNGACCSSGASTCDYATACERNELLGNNGGRASCAGDLSICDTLTLFQTSGVPASGVWSLIECFGSSGFYDFPRTLYRNQFALTTSQTASTVTDTATVTATMTVSRGPAASLKGTEIQGLWICIMPLLMGLFGQWLL